MSRPAIKQRRKNAKAKQDEALVLLERVIASYEAKGRAKATNFDGKGKGKIKFTVNGVTEKKGVTEIAREKKDLIATIKAILVEREVEKETSQKPPKRNEGESKADYRVRLADYEKKLDSSFNEKNTSFMSLVEIDDNLANFFNEADFGTADVDGEQKSLKKLLRCTKGRTYSHTLITSLFHCYNRAQGIKSKSETGGGKLSGTFDVDSLDLYRKHFGKIFGRVTIKSTGTTLDINNLTVGRLATIAKHCYKTSPLNKEKSPEEYNEWVNLVIEIKKELVGVHKYKAYLQAIKRMDNPSDHLKNIANVHHDAEVCQLNQIVKKKSVKKTKKEQEEEDGEEQEDNEEEQEEEDNEGEEEEDNEEEQEEEDNEEEEEDDD